MEKSKPSKKNILSPTKPAEHIYRAFQEFDRLEASGGLVLFGAALLALAWANSPWAETYFSIWHAPITVGFTDRVMSHDLHWWINEALMVIFFFVVGLEIKREVLVGELSSLRQAFLPIAAALGGMLAPAVIYVLINLNSSGMPGWGIPMATDIAFTLGVISLLGSRVPLSLKVFLTALAIVDDIGAVLVIAIFYSGQIQWIPLGIAFLVLIALVGCNLAGSRSPLTYGLLGAMLWLAFLESGVHATLAGVILAMTIPSSGTIHAQDYLKVAKSFLHDFEHAGNPGKKLLNGEQQEALSALEWATEKVEAPLQRFEHGLHPWVTYLIIPLFAFANAGVAFPANLSFLWTDRITLGVLAGLLLGKQVGIMAATWLVVKTRLADLPNAVNWKQIYGIGWLAGVGFTMSLFISSLAFADQSQQEAAKLGSLCASFVATLVGYFLLRRSTRRSLSPG